MNNVIFDKSEFLKMWLENKKLTRRVIEKFPEDQIFTFSIGGMRTFELLMAELLAISVPSLQSIIKNEDVALDEKSTFKDKASLLALWDKDMEMVEQLYNEIPIERFNDRFLLFKSYDGIIKYHFMYFLENEIHHRAQAFVYLRALGIEPPFFWERS